MGALAGLDDETAELTLPENQVIDAGAPQQRSPAWCPPQEGRWGDYEVDDDDDVAMAKEGDPSADVDLESSHLAEGC